MTDKLATHRITVDWPLCQARGLCHELLPDVIDLDPWRFPLILADLRPGQLEAARDAVSACPHRALRLRALPTSRGGGATRT